MIKLNSILRNRTIIYIASNSFLIITKIYLTFTKILNYNKKHKIYQTYIYKNRPKKFITIPKTPKTIQLTSPP